MIATEVISRLVDGELPNGGAVFMALDPRSILTIEISATATAAEIAHALGPMLRIMRCEANARRDEAYSDVAASG